MVTTVGTSLLGSSGLSALAEQQRGLPWWAWLLIIVALILILLFLWWLFSSRKKRALPAEPAPRAVSQQPIPPAAPPATVAPTPVASAPAAPVVAAPAPATPVKPDDLTIVEGIGPKIASVLQAAGITTFAQLAGTDAGRLTEILQGAALRLADPTTWPEQAGLAAAGKWDELQALQNRLKGGRRAE